MISAVFWSVVPGAGVAGGLLATCIGTTNPPNEVTSTSVQISYRKRFIQVSAGRGASRQRGEGLPKCGTVIKCL